MMKNILIRVYLLICQWAEDYFVDFLGELVEISVSIYFYLFFHILDA